MSLTTRLTLVALAATACRGPAREGKVHGNEIHTSIKKESPPLDPKIDRTCDFSVVEGNYGDYPCSPVLGPEHEDVIWINAPEEVAFEVTERRRSLRENEAHFVICGSTNLRTETLHALHIRDELDELVIVAVDTKTHQSYTGHIPHLGTRIPMPEKLRSDDPPMFGYLIGRNFNPNLVRSFDLPAVETDYDVHVVLGPIKSNVLRVRLRRK